VKTTQIEDLLVYGYIHILNEVCKNVSCLCRGRRHCFLARRICIILG